MEAQTNRLYNDVKFLTDLRPYRNYLNLDSLTEVCLYIKEQFTKAVLLIEEQKWIAGIND